MAKKITDVVADPSTAADVIVDPSTTEETPIEETTPSSLGQEDVVDPADEPIVKPDRDIENQLREANRKSDEANAKYQAMLEASFEMERGREANREPVTPAAVEALYAEAEEAGFTRGFVDNLLTTVQGQNAAQMERFQKQHITPHVQNTVESMNRSDVQRLVSQDKSMTPYEAEVMDELRSFGEFRNHPDAPGRAKEIVKGRHVDDILKAGTANARSRAAEDRQLIRTSPSASTVTLDNGQTVPLSGEQKRLCKKIGMSEKEYAEGLAAHHKNQAGGVPDRSIVDPGD